MPAAAPNFRGVGGCEEKTAPLCAAAASDRFLVHGGRRLGRVDGMHSGGGVTVWQAGPAGGGGVCAVGIRQGPAGRPAGRRPTRARPRQPGGPEGTVGHHVRCGGRAGRADGKPVVAAAAAKEVAANADGGTRGRAPSRAHPRSWALPLHPHPNGGGGGGDVGCSSSGGGERWRGRRCSVSRVVRQGGSACARQRRGQGGVSPSRRPTAARICPPPRSPPPPRFPPPPATAPSAGRGWRRDGNGDGRGGGAA